MDTKNLDIDLNLEIRAKKLIREFLKLDPIEKSQINDGFIQSIIEPFLGKKEQFNEFLSSLVSNRLDTH